MPTARSINTCLVCISLGGPSYFELKQQIEQAAQWADVIELRLDRLEFIDLTQLHSLMQLTTLPIIWTLRKKSQGGSFQGTLEQQITILRSILAWSPAFVDVEADTPLELLQALQARSPTTQWIVSWHDMNSTPTDLEALYQIVARHQATYYKIVTFAHSTVDALRMLKFTKMKNQETSIPLCGLCMGDLGYSTRLLAPLVGNPLTFASLGPGKKTAPGQLSADELINTYRFRELNPQTQVLGLIGNPVDKSMSHLTHNAVLKQLNLSAIYLKFLLKEEELPVFFDEVGHLPIKGLSVTMPFKEHVLGYLSNEQELTACNTLLWQKGSIVGYNTDGVGALKALGIPSFKGIKMVILGAGGTAKAVAHAAHQQGAQIAVLNRTSERAKAIAIPLNARWGPLEVLPELCQEGYKCVIQATSVGMEPQIEGTIVPSEWIPPGSVVLDVIAKPPRTRFLREAQFRGCRTVTGQEHFIYQAVEQFIHWFGPNIDRFLVEQTIRTYFPQQKITNGITVRKSTLEGSVSLPPSKSHSIRAIVLAALATGTSRIDNILQSPDCDCAIQAVKQLGAQVLSDAESLSLTITGVAGCPQTPSDIINVGNSGILLRFIGALAALSDGYTVMTGDDSIRSNRPIQPLIDGLKGLNAWAVSTRQNGFSPYIVKGPLQAGHTTVDSMDSQPVSALLMAASFVEGQTTIEVLNGGEKPWLALTLSWLDRLHVSYSHRNLEHFTIQGKRERPAFNVTIPGDLSSAAFPLAAAIVTRSKLSIHSIDLDDIQGDKELIFILQKMGAHIEIDRSLKILTIHPDGQLKGQVIDVNGFIDAVPILAVLGCFAEGETHLINASVARQKECDRLSCLTNELQKMGADIKEQENGLIIRQSNLKGASVDSHRDHRLAMALIIAGLGAVGDTHVQDIECIAKTFPNFIQEMRKLGARIGEYDEKKLCLDRISIDRENHPRKDISRKYQ